MFFYEGQSCPVCGQHFGEKDDIVACPVCGAPHHRACWKQEGHCHFAADHGTDRQWAKEPPAAATPTRNCSNCGYKNPEFAEYCSHCGRELDTEDWQSAYTPPSREHQYTPPTYGHRSPFTSVYGDPFGGVPRSEQIEGVSVETIAQVVGPRGDYYLPRFLTMSRTGKKASWNWSAFLFPCNWLLYRKNMLWGILCFFLSTTLEVFSAFAGYHLQLHQTTPLSPEKLELYLLIYGIAALASAALCIGLGLFGNYLYFRQVLRKARKLQEDPELEYSQRFLTTGGVSIGAAIVPDLIIVFAQYLFLLFTSL